MSKYYIIQISTDYMGPGKLQLTEWKLRQPKTKNPKMISLGGPPGSPIHIVSAKHNPERLLDMWLAPRPKRGAHADPGCSSTNGVDQVALYVKKVSGKVKITWTRCDRKDGELELDESASFSSGVQLVLCRVLDASTTTGDGATCEFRINFASASAPVSATGLASDSGPEDPEVVQRRHHLVVKTVEIMRAFSKQTLITCRPRGPDQTCLEAALALNPRDDLWTKYLHALLRMRAEPSLKQALGTALPRAPAWLTELGPLADLWESLWFRTLFWRNMRTHLIPEAPDLHTTLIKNARGDAREQILYKFRIHVQEDIIQEDITFKDFEGNDMYVNQTAPVGFTHGLNFSQVLSVLLDGARLSRSVRTKNGLKGAWVAKEDDFETCDPYAGPERLLGDHGPWIQAFFVGQTWDLRSPRNHPRYRCITTRNGHMCTHFLLHIWPNNEEENKKLDAYHYRPLGGLNEEQTEAFRQNLVANISMGERGPDPKRSRVGT